MFNDQLFDNWLDKKANEIVVQMGDGKALSPEDMMVLVLKAQTNHFAHLDVELRGDMKSLREDIATDMKSLREDIATDMKSLREDIATDMKNLREDIATDMKNLREDMTRDMKHLREDMDKRFERVDKRFETVISRIDRFMIWSFATTIAVGASVVAAVKLT